MERIVTKNLVLVPLKGDELRLWVNDRAEMERRMGYVYRGEPVMGSFVDFILDRAVKVEEDGGNWLFHTIWFIVHREKSLIMGEIAFCGSPDERGEVEIGYGLNPEYQGHGYMTEAVGHICRWAVAEGGAACVKAETYDNEKSGNTLKYAGFVPVGSEPRGGACTYIWRMP